MKAKSQISTKDAEELLLIGWKLKEFKNQRLGHSYYIHDESRKSYCGSAKYINRDIFMELVRRGHKSSKIIL
jgi:hypothetical protein